MQLLSKTHVVSVTLRSLSLLIVGCLASVAAANVQLISWSADGDSEATSSERPASDQIDEESSATSSTHQDSSATGAGSGGEGKGASAGGGSGSSGGGSGSTPGNVSSGPDFFDPGSDSLPGTVADVFDGIGNPPDSAPPASGDIGGVLPPSESQPVAYTPTSVIIDSVTAPNEGVDFLPASSDLGVAASAPEPSTLLTVGLCLLLGLAGSRPRRTTV